MLELKGAGRQERLFKWLLRQKYNQKRLSLAHEGAAVAPEAKGEILETFKQFSDFENAISNGYSFSCHKNISPEEIKIFTESIIGYDGLRKEILSSPEIVSREIFQNKIHNHLFIPCYIAELRQILENQSIVSNYNIAAFNFETAKKYLSEYSILLVLDKDKISEDRQLEFDGVEIFSSLIHFEDSLVKVLACDKLDEYIVTKIVNEICPGLSTGTVTDLPGIQHKLSQMQFNKLVKFVVNVPSMDIIDETIKSTDSKSALQEALDRKWKETGNPHKNPEFTADYWLSNPIINSDPNQMHNLVHKVAHKYAQAKLQLPLQVEPDEKEIFDLLLHVNQKYNLGLTLRVAGGWVRDRALGIKSKDIDIAIDKMTGAQFCQYITRETGKKPAIIEADEKKSKSLETATINLGKANIPIDFVNLRKEVYEPGSRVPTMTFGTAQEDAERRDFTLNALFYNINSGQVEDLTGKGLEDLQNLTLRTPLEPKQTFADDPLRVFRALRFFAKFKGSKIEENTLKAIFDPEVQEALDPKNTVEVEVVDPKTKEKKIEKQRKISEERILVEWQKLFKGPQATEALRIAHDSGLWQKVFVAGAKDYDMSKWHPFTMDQNNAWHTDNVFEHTLKVINEYDAILEADNASDREKMLGKMAAFFHDLGKLSPDIIGQKEVEGVMRNTYHGHEDVSELAVEAILKGLKASNEDIEYVKTVVKNHMLPHAKLSDKQINKMIRNLGRNMTRRIVQHAKADAMSKPGGDIQHYDSMLQRVQNAQAVDPNQVRPVVPGGTIMQLFPTLIPKSGFIKEIQDTLQDIKDGNPLMTEQDGLMEIEKMRPIIEQKYQNYQATPKRFNLQNQKPKQSSVELICGQIKIIENVLSLVSEKGTFQLEGGEKQIKDISRNVGERICGKGMLNRQTFTISEYTFVRIDPNKDSVSIDREIPQEMSDFREGDRVRHRGRGLAFEQITGRISKIENNLIYVKWDGVEAEEIFDLKDSVPIFAVLQRI